MKIYFKTYMLLALMLCTSFWLDASSHREAPLIANDPLADNTDLYAFRSPDDPNTITIIATYVPMQLPHGGPNYYSFGENIRYEIHVDNDASIPGDEIIYRFTFKQENEDPSTFFNIRLGVQNLKTTYTMERSTDGGATFTAVISDGVVPPNNIGPRSIESGVGLGADYGELMMDAILPTDSGEKVFCGSVDDPFFVDLGGIFDLGDAPRQSAAPSDGLACYNVSAIAIQVPISMLLKAGASSTPTTILDPDYVIGVWASASRQQVKTLSAAGASYEGDWVQVSRLGMPLTNEAVIPIGQKDFWNAISPYDEISETTMDAYFYNPELALYMDDALFGGAVPAFSPLRVQRNSLGAFDFGNGNDGLYGLKGSAAVEGTALDDAVFGTLLLPGPGLPRSVDLWPTFHTGVPNVIPYQLATGKEGNPLAAGKPFVHNFLPNGGDMLRLNMAVPVTARDDASFSNLGLINAAVLGLLDPAYNATTDIQAIPNMDGFPNGRRLEDDVTRIELQAVAGAVLAAVGLWYDDFDPESGNPVTEDLLDVLGYTTGVEENDRAFLPTFPFLAMPNSGTGPCSGAIVDYVSPTADLELNISVTNTNYSIFQEVPYQITVTNTGNVTATGVNVSAEIPEAMVFSGVTASQGEYILFFEMWEVGTLEPGASATLDLTLYTLEDNGPITNFVEVLNANQPDLDSDPGNDMDAVADEDDEDAVTIMPGEGGGGMGEGFADLSLMMTTANSSYGIYQAVPYTITVTNDGPDDAENVMVKAALPATMVFTGANATQGEYVVFFERWEVGTLASGASASLTLTLFTLSEDAPITNFVQVLSVEQADPDSAPANNMTMVPVEDDEAAVTIIPQNAARMINSRANAKSQFAKGDFDVKVYPTLVNSGAWATMEINTPVDFYGQIIVADAIGRPVSKASIQVAQGFNTYQLDIAKLPAGMYLVSVLKGNQPTQTQKIFISE